MNKIYVVRYFWAIKLFFNLSEYYFKQNFDLIDDLFINF